MHNKRILIGLVIVLGLSGANLLFGVVTLQVQAMPAIPTWLQMNADVFRDVNTCWSCGDNAKTIFNADLYVATDNFISRGVVWQMTNDTPMVYLPLVIKNYSSVETGKIVFVSNRDGNDEIYSMNYDGSGVTRLTNNTFEDSSPDWSPDGSKIVFDSNRSGEYEIYVMDANGGNQTKITTMTHNYVPQWSPDGTRIAFYTRQSNNNIIYTMDPDGSDLFQVTDPALSGYDPYWSPDGLRIAFFSSRTTAGIYVIDTDGTDQTLMLASNDIGYFAWSPDGTKLALSKTVPPNYNFDLFVYYIGSGITTRLTDTTLNHLSVDWSPEGRHLIFHSNRENLFNFEIYTMTANGSDITNISNNPAADSQPDWVK